MPWEGPWMSISDGSSGTPQKHGLDTMSRRVASQGVGAYGGRAPPLWTPSRTPQPQACLRQPQACLRHAGVLARPMRHKVRHQTQPPPGPAARPLPPRARPRSRVMSSMLAAPAMAIGTPRKAPSSLQGARAVGAVGGRKPTAAKRRARLGVSC